MNRTEPGIRYRVSIAPITEPLAMPLDNTTATHHWCVESEYCGFGHSGIAKSRADAWQLALATLRGMIALARIRKAA